VSDDRELVYDHDESGPRSGDVLWVFEFSDTKQRIAVLNARWGDDVNDDGNHISVVEHDGWTIDGRSPTDDEDAELYDFVFDAVEEMLSR
jgi:hypothetical protein